MNTLNLHTSHPPRHNVTIHSHATSMSYSPTSAVSMWSWPSWPGSHSTCDEMPHGATPSGGLSDSCHMASSRGTTSSCALWN